MMIFDSNPTLRKPTYDPGTKNNTWQSSYASWTASPLTKNRQHDTLLRDIR